jgi:hypothetical protein
MATTLSTIFEQATGLSLRNRREAIADEASELVMVVNRLMTDAFLEAAAINPERFGLVDDVAFLASPVGGWPRPARALSVYRIEGISGSTSPAMANYTEIAVVPEHDLSADRWRPCVFERGGVFYSGRTTPSPVGGSLRFYYARRPLLLAANSTPSSTEIDSSFPDEMVPLIVYGVALYLAQKDNRAEEIAVLTAQYGEWRALWQRYLEQSTTAVRYRWAPRKSTTPAVQVLSKEPS